MLVHTYTFSVVVTWDVSAVSKRYMKFIARNNAHVA